MQKSLVFLAALCGASEPNPVRKIVNVLEDMKKDVHNVTDTDNKVWNKFKCSTTKSIADHKAQIEELTEKIEGLEVSMGELKTTITQDRAAIEMLGKKIETNQATFDKNVADRAEQQTSFEATREDKAECVRLLGEAVSVLKGEVAENKTVPNAVFMQVKKAVKRSVGAGFESVMQRDLFDVLGSMEGTGNLRKTSLAQKALQPTLADSQPKSYNKKSGMIVGMLEEMHRQFDRDLKEAIKKEGLSVALFEDIQGNLSTVIAADTKEIELKKAANVTNSVELIRQKGEFDGSKTLKLTETDALEEEKAALEAEEKAHGVRQLAFTEEMRVISEVIDFLTSDEARDLARSVYSFVQIDSVSAAMQKARAKNAMNAVVKAAKQHNDWALVSLALKGEGKFDKVIQILHNMTATLKAQQAEDDESLQTCKDDLDEHTTNTATNLKNLEHVSMHLEKVGDAIDDHVTSEKRLNSEIVETVKDIEQTKLAHEERAAELTDEIKEQTAMVKLLKAAFDMVSKHYNGNKTTAVESFTIVGLFEGLISNTTSSVTELKQEKADEAKVFGEMVTKQTTKLNAMKSELTSTKEARATAEAERAEKRQTHLTLNAEQASLVRAKAVWHQECDYIMKNGELRRQARAFELETIVNATYILKGERIPLTE